MAEAARQGDVAAPRGTWGPPRLGGLPKRGRPVWTRHGCLRWPGRHTIAAAMATGPPSEQPTAPYLDAVVAYAFRGPARYHVPGHKGGPGADPGVRKALGRDALAADVPQDIHGIDLGPSPTPYERAELLAAEA